MNGLLGNVARVFGFGPEQAKVKPLPYSPTKEEEKVLEVFHETCGDTMTTDVTPRELGWIRLVSMLENDFEGYAVSTQIKGASSVPMWRKRYWASKLRPSAERAVTALVGPGATPRVIPAGPERIYRERASVGQDVWAHWCRENDFAGMSRYFGLLMWLMGTAYIHPYWDLERGPIGSRSSDGRPIRRGEVTWDMVPPIFLRVDPLSRRGMEKARWADYNRLHTIEAIRARWPKRWRYVQPEMAGADITAWRELRLKAAHRFGSSIIDPTIQRVGNAAVVHEVYRRSCDRFPLGLYAAVAGNVVLEHGPNPLVLMSQGGSENELPFFAASWYEAIERVHGDGPAEAAELLLRESNNAKSRVIEAMILMGHPTWIAPKNSGIGEVVAAPGKILRYNAGSIPPQMIAPPPIPAHIPEMIGMIDADYDDVVSQHPPSQGEATQARAGYAIQLLQQKDEAVGAGSRISFWRALRLAARHTLALKASNQDAERTASILGPDGKYRIRRYVGSDLLDATNIDFLIDESFGLTRAAQLGTINDLQASGFLNGADPFHAAMVAEALQSSSMKSLYADLFAAQEEADRELMEMTDVSNGMPPRIQAKPWQNHEVHKRIKNLYRTTQSYLELPELHRQMLDANIDEHEIYLLQQMMQQQEQVEASKGAPGQKGTPSPPKSGSAGERPDGAAKGPQRMAS